MKENCAISSLAEGFGFGGEGMGQSKGLISFEF